MKIVVLIFILFINLNLIFSLTCPTGYNYSPTNGCVNGPQIISSGLCYYSTAKTVLIFNETNANPCPSGTETLYWNSMNIENNSFNWVYCQIPASGFSYYQVGSCTGESYEIPANSRTIRFTYQMSNFVANSCYSGGSYYFSGSLSATPDYGGCSNMGFSVFKYLSMICPNGFDGIAPNCNDINECLVNNGGCGQICNNFEGGSSCSCDFGFVLKSDGLTCTRDCNTNNGGCSQICGAGSNGNVCSCQNGFTLSTDDNEKCIDINECLVNNGGCGQICNNFDGGSSCSCKVGFILNGDSKTCTRDCNTNNGGCSQNCGVGINGNVCSCRAGFTISVDDSEACTDIDECASSSTNNCNTNETCKNSKGSYNCFYNHFISSIIPSTTKGGEASFIGEFGNSYENITLSIGNIDCPITYVSLDLIKCNATAGIGYHTVNLTQNGIVFIGVDKYQYKAEIQTCLDNCNSDKQQGICNTTNGECNCLKGYTGFSCSSPPNSPSTNSSIDPNTGGTDFVNGQTNFQIYIKYLHELDFNGNKVKSFSLQNKWKLNNTNENNNNIIYKLDQLLSLDLISNKNDTVIGCKVTSIIEEIKDQNGKEFTFGDTTFKVENGLIKYSISISNYTYSSFLNTLQLELVSSVNDLNKDESNCNSKDTEINSNELSTFNYIKISKNNKIFSGRFINHLISDGKSTFFKTTITKESNSIIISLNLPHFKYNCLIDPDFSVLVSPDFKTSCGSSSNNRKWVIPVAVVVSVVGFATLVAIVFIIYKKSTSAKIVLQKLKKLGPK